MAPSPSALKESNLRQELAPIFSQRKIGCRGFKGPSPSTTLDKDVVLLMDLVIRTTCLCLTEVTLSYQITICQSSAAESHLLNKIA